MSPDDSSSFPGSLLPVPQPRSQRRVGENPGIRVADDFLFFTDGGVDVDEHDQ